MIEYKDTKEFTTEELERLFLSVNWPSGKFPNELKIAMANSDQVISAWSDSKLIGLVNSISDGILTVYFHYLLIDPDFHGMGIGKELMKKAMDRYKSFKTRLVISLSPQVEFYKKCGFKAHPDKTPLFSTELNI